ncbi:c-type cytochrome biogenesis protein CcmI [Paraburkholderia fungorum]|uniref:C-type cytochrome biogenesis protein CcmI n=1 Tax=Paraburkholderia fungorum TaxID=134537 RepID=A0A3R7IMP6_9BURK|nr:c-type cytochrome biogenesis protein CcmI [Paraburkholderia fungorum]RKF46650.1 c-type cytochrome biogenesis protein CcmI [Paraburkholderia fungorum]
MIQFWLIVAAMLLAALLCVIVPLLSRGSRGDMTVARADGGGAALATAIFRTDMAELERQAAAGDLPDAQHGDARREIERRFADEIGAKPAAAAMRAGSIAQRAATAAVLLALLPSAALILYMRLGGPLAVAVQADSAAGPQDSHAATQGSLDLMVGRLAARLRRQPDDPAGWTMLARSYAVLERPDDAAAAYRRALDLTPRDPQLLADYADALASANGGDLTGAPLQSIDAALALDPANPKALALAGSAAFEARDYPRAIQYWQRLEQAPGVSVEIANQARANVAEAHRLASGAAAEPDGAAPLAGVAGQGAAAAAAPSAALVIHVRLSPELAALARPGDVVFVYARATNGPRMPLAVQRLHATQLPATVRLDDSMAMAPDLRLSNFAAVTVEARVSASGSAQPGAGDWVGTSGPLTGERRDVELTIGEVLH